MNVINIVTTITLMICGSAYASIDVDSCKAIALSRTATVSPHTEETEYWLDKVTPMVQLPAAYIQLPNQNVCSTVSFADKTQQCDSLFIKIKINSNGSSDVRTFAESKKYDNIVEYHQEFQAVSTDHYIYKGSVLQMWEHGRNKQKKDVDIPAFVKDVQGQLFALIDVDPDKDWTLYATCSREYTWAFITKKVQEGVDEKYRKEVFAEIDEAIRKHNEKFENANKIVDKTLIFDL